MAKKNILYRSKLKSAKKLLADNKFDQAKNILTRLSIQAPRDADIWSCLGFIAGKSKQYDKAVEYYGNSVSLCPGNASALYNYGIALRDAGEIQKAIEFFRKSLELDPNNTVTLDCLAHVYMMLSEFDKASEVFTSSLRIDPHQAGTHTRLGAVYQAQGKLSKAEQCYRQAIRIDASLNIADSLGSVLVAQGRLKESVGVYLAGLNKQPKNARLFSNYLLTLNYLDDMPVSEIFREHKRFGKMFERKITKSCSTPGTLEHRKIRIGYCSPDFREHSVAYFIEPIFNHHDKSVFEVFAYNISPKHDAVTERLKQTVDEWRNISSITTAQIAELVKNDGIDILVDLAGHTAHNCLLAFIYNPAPVQITYLGYPNTTGLGSMHYRLTDKIADPDDLDQYYTETLLKIPGSFLCFNTDDDCPTVTEPPCLANGYVTFGSFNNLSKINDKVIEAWSDIIHSVDGSRILIKNPSLTDQKTRERYYKLFRDNGVNEDRVVLIGHTKTRFEHLALYSKIDISLDTFPYNGTTTTCEALWMGVPVITLAGDRHASRVGYSLLHAADCLDWVAHDRQEYLNIASEIVSSPGVLGGIRKSLREKIRHSSLCNAANFTTGLESIYRRVLKKHGQTV